MNLSRLGWVFLIVFVVIVLMELRWFLEIYGLVTLVPIAIFLVVVFVGVALLRGYVEPPTSLADGDANEEAESAE